MKIKKIKLRFGNIEIEQFLDYDKVRIYKNQELTNIMFIGKK